MKQGIQPIMVIPAVPIDTGLRFLHPDRQLDIEKPISETVWRILAHANGYNTLEAIVEEVKLDWQLVEEVVTDLIEIGVVVDSREQYRHFHQISSNPSGYSCNLSDMEVAKHQQSPGSSVKPGEALHFHANSKSRLMRLQSQRRSVRSFSNQALSRDQIGQICDLGYNLSRHAVPSGGGLFPLKLFIVVATDQKELPAGYYEYDAGGNVLIRFDETADAEMLKFIFSGETLPYNSSVQIVIAADITRQTYKYSNRGYRLTLIEVGQVAQNIVLGCAELGLSSCELSSFLDVQLSQELMMNDGVMPLLTIAVGYESRQTLVNPAKSLAELSEQFVGDDQPIKMVGTTVYLESSFHGAFARFGDGKHDVAGATASSPEFARAKAVIEAYERYCSGQVRTDIFGSTSELSGEWLDPRRILPLTDEQIARQNLAKFDEDMPVSWTCGEKLDGSAIWVPSDIVYYGHKSDGKRIAWANSSGIAAFTDDETAANKAVLELIERDALMRNWFSRQSPMHLSSELLSAHLCKRMKFWQDRDREVHVLLMPSQFAVVIQVVITSETYPCFVSGAAASATSLDEAITKAFQEAEYGLVSAIHQPSEPIQSDHVHSPTDHGRLYAFSDHVANIAWLWSGEVVSDIPPLTKSIEQIKLELDIVIVNLSEANSPIRVVRVFSEKLVPIGFGYGNDYFTHSSIDVFDPASQGLPHYFA